MLPEQSRPVERTTDYDYPLPEELVAQFPSATRGNDRLLVLQRATGEIAHHQFAELPDLLHPKDLLVINESRVLKARILGAKTTGGSVELLLVRRLEAGWLTMVQARRGVRPGMRVQLGSGRYGELVSRHDEGLWEVRFQGFSSDDAVPDEAGVVPLPPYIRRSAQSIDDTRYQTVFAREPGSVAAPTAGLHFTPEIFERLAARGIEVASITLHVGPGTFRPVRTELLRDHRIDPELFSITEAAARAIRAATDEARRVVAVGTTVTRALETAARSQCGFAQQTSWTDLFIHPPFRFHVVRALLTNFHLPRSSLIALVATFAGREPVLAAYAEAVKEHYRFYSYGDAMLIV
ncbi:tRNA preQ1(34) S-adenosylmethionine ribosyltransferase-isomerase QueA [Candidatus Fermentibacteria bacterium]|nr:tRNA preQ1(34) S-adenosylmethionine ribosyltransferase-isomerase QueA [Candidatus Fermentibacteria bacterium]